MRGHLSTLPANRVREKSALTHVSGLNEGQCIYYGNGARGCVAADAVSCEHRRGVLGRGLESRQDLTKLLAPSSPAFCSLVP